jgi:hypothetical protein
MGSCDSEAAPLSETTATAPRTAAAATGSLKTAAAVRPAVASPTAHPEQDGLTDG